ncbi:MAG: hypothetical protein CM1200mP24_02830 [Gammaproteobacteria bacterium]|nr:MAG: hypothetical protein CM1200mP24_02830 [Gammaproteobacteria bacterium]
MTYAFSRIRTTGHSYQSTLMELGMNNDRALFPAKRWGAFYGLFGMHSSEFFLVTSGDVGSIHEYLISLKISQTSPPCYSSLRAPPLDTTPLAKEGLYVFRFFDVAQQNVKEIASLSKTAWETFEDSSLYKAQPQALFANISLPPIRSNVTSHLVRWSGIMAKVARSTSRCHSQLSPTTSFNSGPSLTLLA